MLKEKFFTTSVESIRESMRRALDRRCTATKFGELIDKHGRHDWLEPVAESFGPCIQLQLGDIANMLEVFSKSVEVYDYVVLGTLTSSASQLLPLEVSEEDGRHTNICSCLSFGIYMHGHGLLYEDCFVHYWRHLLLLLANRQHVSQVSIFGIPIQVGIVGYSDKW